MSFISDQQFLNGSPSQQLLKIYKALLAGGGGGGSNINTVYTITTLKALDTTAINDRAYFVDETGGIGGLHVWRLGSGTTAEDLSQEVGVAHPADYAAVTNEKIFSREI